MQGALQYDGRALGINGRYHLVERLLEGRWLTFERPDDPQWFHPDIDLQCLDGLADRSGVPLATGGLLTRSTYGGSWAGPKGWVPPGEVIGLRLVAAVAHVSSVDVDDDLRQRGERLVARLEGRLAPGSNGGHRGHTVANAVLRLLHEDDEALRQPVPPLQRLFPAPAPDPRHYGQAGSVDTKALHVVLSSQVYAGLVEAAAEAGVPVDTWVADELARLYAWPRLPGLDRYGRFTEPWRADGDETDWGSSSVVPLDRRWR